MNNYQLISNQVEQFKKLRDEVTRVMMMYQFALTELETKIEILKEEYQLLHDYNPIEHTKSRVKSFESIIGKIQRKNLPFSINSIRNEIKDVAGIRITCSFISDIYRVQEMLQKHFDVEIYELKDYISDPKPNGYRSLHLIAGVPVVMTTGREIVCVEIQIRTIAMDFWASLEHKIFYKYDQAVPSKLTLELKQAADAANNLDEQMERLHHEITIIKENQDNDDNDEFTRLLLNQVSKSQLKLPNIFEQAIIELPSPNEMSEESIHEKKGE
ncbi:GTP pyrophosphokinase [Paenibacillus endoradicis]|uniref:GTP pyrophosphokinase n=1 Tax=Paenibacillus endoradicis TaxID=2972487 RepID=UPI002159385F|nr:GTP pyrophosphokinase family protein [Paenibacillus endoradicis]MCR8656970.1 GTP pyrophosphokinase family protein [Paenibacillus endoradicis]